MKVNGEYLFKSFEEALDFVNAPTNYEKQNNITIKDKIVLIDEKDFKVVSINKSDKSDSLFLFFKNSTKYDIWKFWCPSELQFEKLSKTVKLYEEMNKVNEKWRKRN